MKDSKLLESKTKLMIYTESFLPYSESFIIRQSLNFKNLDIEFKYRRKLKTHYYSQLKSDAIVSRCLFSRLRFSLMGVSPRFREEIKSTRVVLIHHGLNAWRFWKNLSNANIALFVICHGSDVFRKKHIWYGYTNWQFNRNLESISCYVTKYIAISRAVKEKLIEKGIPAEKIEIKYIGTECQSFESVRKDFDLVFVGRLEENKGPKLFLDAVKTLERPLKVAIIGSGKMQKILKKEASAISMHTINFLGILDQSNVIQVLRRSRICVVPSLTSKSGVGEGLSMVAIESLSVGTPIIVSTCGGLPETIAHGGGISFQEGDKKALADSISQLIESEDNLEMLKEEAVAAQRKYFCIEKNSANLEELFKVKEE